MELQLADHKQDQLPVAVNERDFIAVVRQEIADYYRTMCRFGQMEPTEVFLYLSAWAARASEVRSLLNDIDSRLCNTFRTKQIDPFLDACDMQFKLHSRIQAVRDMEFKLSGGAP